MGEMRKEQDAIKQILVDEISRRCAIRHYKTTYSEIADGIIERIKKLIKEKSKLKPSDIIDNLEDDPLNS